MESDTTSKISEEQWKEALRLVNEDGKSKAEVARSLGVPVSTLKTRVQNSRTGCTKRGALRALPSEVEATFAAHVIEMADAGFAYSKSTLQDFARQFGRKAGIPPQAVNAGNDW